MQSRSMPAPDSRAAVGIGGIIKLKIGSDSSGI